MGNAVLDRLQEQRAAQVEFVDNLLSHVEADGRDLVEAERGNLAAARQRINELDEQIRPLEDFETMRAASTQGTPRPPTRRPETPVATRSDLIPAHYTAGHLVVDQLRSRGLLGEVDPTSTARVDAVKRVVANQLLADVPGLLPVPIVGDVLNTISASRPLITSLGPRDMGGIPGSIFQRPKITQHTTAGKQTAEKTELASQKLKIDPVNFNKMTYGGTVDVSRQVIDWSSPPAWNIITTDLADAYAVATDTDCSTAFAAGITTNSVQVETGDLAGWSAALYQGAAKVYRGCGRLPNRIWCALDVWATLGALVDQARLIFPPGASEGSSSLTDFAGVVLNVPRIVVPTFADGTCVIGASAMFEVYEDRIGLLTAVEPSILGVEVAFGGYVAWGFLEEDGFCKILPPVAGP